MVEREPVTTLAALGLTAQGGADAEISGLSVDSRKTRPGHLFAALPGTRVHGAEFIQYALRMGAAAVLTDPEGARLAHDVLFENPSVALVVTEDPRAALAYAAALFYGRQPPVMVAVTGTNGKTSVASFTRQIWQLLGHEAANIGTTGVEGAFAAPATHTTPEPITLHELLADMAAHGVSHAAMEASSHGLEQRRLDGVNIVAAGFTNLSQDHLDYHADLEAYFEAKAGLFDRVLPADGLAVLNTDDARGRALVDRVKARGQQVLTVGHGKGCDLHITNHRYGATGQELRFHWLNKPHQVRLNLLGGFQADNVMMAAGLCIASGSDPQAVFDCLEDLTTVRGRMELSATRANGAAVFVDYAHTPDAIATALQAMRPHVFGKLIVVFGAGGDRDTSKRKLMGEAAAKHADVVIVTDDNPRSENPSDIRAMVMEGCPEANEVGDRAEAILRGVDMLEAGDALLIAGKRHETGQVIGDDTLPFDDAEQASVAVAALEGRLA